VALISFFRDGSAAETCHRGRSSLPARELWQPGFFDHVLRSDESYAEKWQDVLENPVRAGLVREMEEWPHQREIVLIDRV
jgi:hypothetical protein